MREKFDEAWELLKKAGDIRCRAELMAARSIANEALDAHRAPGEIRHEALRIFARSWQKDLMALASGGGVNETLYQQAFRNAVAAHEELRVLTEQMFGKVSIMASFGKSDLAELYLEHGAATSWVSRSEGRRWRVQGIVLLKEAKQLAVKIGDDEEAASLQGRISRAMEQ